MARNKSTGPKTDEGKKRISQNALKNGVYSQSIVLPSENQADFELLHQRFIDDFKPQDIVGSQLVHDMTAVIWKRMRLERIENKVLTDILNAPIREEEAVGTIYLWRKEVAVIVGVKHLLNDEYLRELDTALQYAIQFQEGGLGEEEVCKLAKSIPGLDGMLNLSYPDYELTPSYKLLGSRPQVLKLKLSEDAPFQEILAAAIQEMRENQWLGAHRNGILKEYEVVRNRRLIKFMENAGTSRAFDDLRRSLSKLMAEFRKHEDWRNERAILDMGIAESAHG